MLGGVTISDNLSKEQIAHDLTIAYITCESLKNSAPIDPESFVQEYGNSFPHFLKYVDSNL